ncbi:MAG: hypothetical protein OXG79_13900 [Chloroflexi bacterium]|nr:hypothetical protein [Chloroflexota bacterium]
MTAEAPAATGRAVGVPRSRWWLLLVRAVVPLIYANAQIGLLWPEDLKAPPAIIFGIFALADGALALAVALGVREFRPARGLILTDAALGAVAGIAGFALWLVVWSETVVPAAAYVGLAGTWAFLSGLLHAAVAIPLRRIEGAQIPLLFIIVSGLVRMAYGVPTGMSALVVLNFTGFRRFLSVQQWFVLLHGISYLLFYGGLAEVWRGRRQAEVATQERIARKNLQVRRARERRAAQGLRTA